MTAKLVALAVALLAALHGHLTVAGASVSVQALVLILLLALCAAAAAVAGRHVLAFRSSPSPRPVWRCA
jgi:hypothetical protein